MPDTTEKLAYRLNEATDVIGIGKSKLFELIAAGEIKTLKVGTRTLIEVDELKGYLARLRAARDAA